MPLAYEWLIPLAPWEEAETLASCIKSLNAQSLRAVRLVVSVDGTLTEELRRVLDLASMPVLLLEKSHWTGTGQTLARGLKACECKWILRADADDLAHEERAEVQINYLQTHPDIAVLGAQMYEHSSCEQSPRIRSVPTSPEGLAKTIYWRNPINHPTVAFSREAILGVGGYRDIRGFEDWDLWLRVHKAGLTIVNLSNILVTASVGGSHLTRRHGSEYLKQEVRFLLLCFEENLMPRIGVLVLALTRLPWRKLPKRCLHIVMQLLRTSPKAMTGKE